MKTPQQNRESVRRWRLRHPERHRAKNAAWRAKAHDWIRDYNRRWRATHPNQVREHSRAATVRMKREMVSHLGGRCLCCNETRMAFLTLDHIGGGGGAHRKIVGPGYSQYLAAKREGWPRDKYRCLCMNCNFAIGRFGQCPHEAESLSLVSCR